jgi:hypothetical protein
MRKHDKPSYDQRPRYNAADHRTPEQREQELLRSARAEGREQPADGSRPLSVAHEGKPSTEPDKEDGKQGQAATDERTQGPGDARR